MMTTHEVIPMMMTHIQPNLPEWYHDMSLSQQSRMHGDNGTTLTNSTTHQSSYIEYDDDGDSTIESYPPAYHPDQEDSSNTDEEETVHHRNQSFDESPGHASNDTSNPFRNETIPEDNSVPEFPDLLSTLPQQSLRQSSRLQAIPNNSWDPHTRIRNNVHHANQVALLSETAFYPNDPQDISGYEYALEAFIDSIPPPGKPGSDPLPFLLEPG